MNNGWASNFSPQGCPLRLSSLPLPFFFLSDEILAKAIGKNADVIGSLVKDTEVKSSQYPDDATLIIDGSEKSLSLSGLRLYSKKTEALWIGSCAGKNEKLYPERI